MERVKSRVNSINGNLSSRPPFQKIQKSIDSLVAAAAAHFPSLFLPLPPPKKSSLKAEEGGGDWLTAPQWLNCCPGRRRRRRRRRGVEQIQSSGECACVKAGEKTGREGFQNLRPNTGSCKGEREEEEDCSSPLSHSVYLSHPFISYKKKGGKSFFFFFKFLNSSGMRTKKEDLIVVTGARRHVFGFCLSFLLPNRDRGKKMSSQVKHVKTRPTTAELRYSIVVKSDTAYQQLNVSHKFLFGRQNFTIWRAYQALLCCGAYYCSGGLLYDLLLHLPTSSIRKKSLNWVVLLQKEREREKE